jgi:hypothetical protein
MTHHGRSLVASFPWLGTALLAGCSLLSDLDRFEAAPAGGSGGGGGKVDGGASDASTADGGGAGETLACANPRTMCVRLESWPHQRQLTVVDLVTDSDNNLRARAVLDPFPEQGAVAEIVLPLAIPEFEVPEPGEDHPLHFEIWADASDDGEYTPDTDHDWERDVPESGNFVFVHDPLFNDLLPRPREFGADFVMRFRDMQVHAGLMLEVMVIEEATGRTVGLERLDAIPNSSDFEIAIPGIIDPGGVVYRVEFYADANDNHRYDGLPTDHAWVKEFVESGDKGIETDFTHGLDFTELEYQFEFEE